MSMLYNREDIIEGIKRIIENIGGECLFSFDGVIWDTEIEMTTPACFKIHGFQIIENKPIQNATISVEEEGKQWIIIDNKPTYKLKKENGRIYVYIIFSLTVWIIHILSAFIRSLLTTHLLAIYDLAVLPVHLLVIGYIPFDSIPFPTTPIARKLFIHAPPSCTGTNLNSSQFSPIQEGEALLPLPC